VGGAWTGLVAQDAIVVGAGVMGLATAWLLAEHGLDVTVVEQAGIASGASGASAGLLAPHYDESGDGALAELARRGLALHRAWAERLRASSGIDYHFGPMPGLSVALSEQEAAPMVRRGCAPGRRWLSRADARAIEPRLGPRVVGGVLDPDQCQVETYPFSLALAAAAERAGARIRSGTVTRVLHRAGRVSGAVANRQRLGADVVVLAAGPWTGRFAPQLGHPIPVVPVRGQILWLDLPGQPLRVALSHGHHYVVRKPAGATLLGTTREWVGFRPMTTRRGERDIVRQAVRLLPAILEGGRVRQTACLRPWSGDDRPIIGPVPGWEGLHLITGHGPQGILLSLVSARILADLIVEGRADPLLVEFSPERFSRLPGGPTAHEGVPR
jgi:glycine oxidase